LLAASDFPSFPDFEIANREPPCLNQVQHGIPP
jgi:hypothetical protein